MAIQVKVVACGPISNAELTLPEREIVAIIGSLPSGKRLLFTLERWPAQSCLLPGDHG
ncbi:MAG: hypothetical protein QXU69_08630 [Thermofilaceae archaeon]